MAMTSHEFEYYRHVKEIRDALKAISSSLAQLTTMAEQALVLQERSAQPFIYMTNSHE